MEHNPRVLEELKKDIATSEEGRKKARFQHSLVEFLNGRIEILKNDEFVSGLTDYLQDTDNIEREHKVKVLQSLRACALGEDIVIRERTLTVMSPATQYMLKVDDEKAISVIADIYLGWLAFETELLPAFTVISKRIEAILDYQIDYALFEEAEKMFLLLSHIQSGKIKKSGAIRAMTGKTLEYFERKSNIEFLTDGFLRGGRHQPYFKTILIALGDKASIYLFNRMINSHSRKERLQLIELISAFGQAAVPGLLECLRNDPPWAVVRNIIGIFGELGFDENYPQIEHYFQHVDERVQHEMIRCVIKLGPDLMHRRLQVALTLVNDRLKIHIIRLLLDKNEKEEETFWAINNLAEKRHTFSASTGMELLSTIVNALKRFPRNESVLLLRNMQADYQKMAGFGQIILLITEALNVIEPKLRHIQQGGEDFQESVFYETDPVLQQSVQKRVQKIEDNVQALLNSGDQGRAAQLIYDQAVVAAHEQDYPAAEMLRDRILEVNPMALSEVLELSELIHSRKRKSSSIASHHLDIWSELYEEMDTEEFNGLYCSLQQESYGKNEIIVKAGETDTSLYFLSSGFVSLSCCAGGKEVFLKRMQPSDVLGSEQFFSASVWTVTIKAMSEVQVHVLEYSKWQEILREFPGIEEKFRYYCDRHEKVSNLLKMSWEDRREYPRHPVSLITNNILFDPYGKKGKRSLTGELINISRGGFTFTIKISSLENARRLLGRQVISAISFGGRDLYTFSGVIVAVRINDQQTLNFRVHVKLSTKIEKDTLKEIVTLGK